GAYAWVYYALHWGTAPNLPKINKMVVLAGPYNGIMNKGHANQPTNGELAGLWDDSPRANYLMKNGRPKIIHEEYRRLLERKNDFPTNTRVLNIYGDLKDGTRSDGLVTEPSVRSLKYLVANRAKSYQEYEIKGEMGQHSRLHIDNPEVSDKLTQYLWGK
ncbi:alpha/beta hydrolase, partial [Ligilactobacillus salitolerans]